MLACWAVYFLCYIGVCNTPEGICVANFEAGNSQTFYIFQTIGKIKKIPIDFKYSIVLICMVHYCGVLCLSESYSLVYDRQK